MTPTAQMQDIFGSVRRSLVFRGSDAGNAEDGISAGTLVDKIGSCIRKSKVFSRSSPPRQERPLSPDTNNCTASIRWRKGELIGCGAFGRVYMGMNLDSGELLAVKQVLINGSNASKEKAQAHIRELEEEVKLLKNLSHSNIVRYLGTVMEDDTLNIFLEFVPGGSISSLLGKFGSFPEPVIKMYTKQLLLGLEYLHNNGIMHRDIKGANILVDNKGGIKLADFGASKRVAELATISGAKSMKGTPYWMAPEVILQTGHNFSADIWSVGCTIIEMATGKPPWSQQYQEVAALFHIGTTKAHPPIPDHLSVTARNFLMKCLQKEPNLRPKASELLQHPFVTGEKMESLPLPYAPDMNQGSYRTSGSPFASNREIHQVPMVEDSMDMCELGSLSSSTAFPKKAEPQFVWAPGSCEDDMCQIGEGNDFGMARENLTLMCDFSKKSFNPVSEPSGNWKCDFNGRLGHQHGTVDLSTDWHSAKGADSKFSPSNPSTDRHSAKGIDNMLSPSDPSLSEDEDEVTESKIKAFLEEKAWELKKLQTPLYEEFYNTMCGTCSPSVKKVLGESEPVFLKLPPKGRSPNQIPTSTPCKAPCDGCEGTPRSSSTSNLASPDVLGSQSHEWKGILVDAPQETSSTSTSFSEKERKWKEELDQELERKREMMRQAGHGGRTLSPKDRGLSRQRDRSRFASPAK